MTLAPGSRHGPYEITAKLGEGGMGEVWRATDARLRRDVAIKVLPVAFTADPERLARFEREAQVLAQLQHPNIAAIYGLEEADGVRALVLELVEGPTLAERLERGALPLDEALAIARQIAEALEEAHAKGIVHRDLKPQNVKVTSEGRVKVLDFGLAKALDPSARSSSASELAHSPTLTLGATVQGVILGTAAYMAPEQAKGLAVDKRADIWALGVVLWEMLAGRRLFAGDSVPETLAGVLKTEIDFGALPAGTPPRLHRLLRRCLERNPRNRLHDVADARIVLDELIGGGADESAATAVAPRRPWAALATVGIAALALGALAGWRLSAGAGAAAPPRHLSLVVPDDLRVESSLIAPDGTAVFLNASRRADPPHERQIFRRPLDGPAPVPIPGTHQSLGFLVSPDARWLVFVQRNPADPSAQRVMRVPSDGSQPPIELFDRDPTWSDLGVLADGEPFAVVNAQALQSFERGEPAGEPLPIEVGRAGNFRVEVSPPLPDDLGILLTMESWTGRGFQQGTVLADPKTGKGSVLIEDGGNAFFVAPDRLLYTRGSTLHAVRFDPRARRLLGRPVALLEGLRIEEAWEASRFSYSNDGTLLYAPGGLVGAARRFVILDPESGAIEPWSGETRPFRGVRTQVSADARFVYAQLANAAGTYEIWRVPRSGPAQPVVAETEADAQSPALSRDGRRIAFGRVGRLPSDGLFVAPVDRSEPPRSLLRSADEGGPWPIDWTPDGHILAMTRTNGRFSIIEVSPERPGERRELVPAESWSPQLSPDGRRLAFGSDVSGRPEIYLADYPASGAIGERIAVSRDGAEQATWSADGRTLFFSDLAERLFAIAVSAAGRPEGQPRLVADLGELKLDDELAALPDGRLVTLQQGPDEGEIRRLEVVLNFDRILEQRLP